jgi:predicted TIM-barrel fold metal-dependent hydrolase
VREYRYISADGHLEVSPDNWRPYVDREFLKWCPTVVRLDNGGDAWQMPGGRLVPLGLNYASGRGWKHLKTTGISYAENPAGSGDGKQRLHEMDMDGIDAEVLFPAVWLQRSMDGLGIPREASIAIARGYNDWLSREFTAVDRDRLLGVAILPISSAGDAAEELRRVAKMPGIRTVVMHAWPNGGPKPDPDADSVFWKAAEETGMPVSVHVQFGGGRAADVQPEGSRHFAPITLLLTRASGPGPDTAYCATQLITSRVFDHFPSLRIAFAESGAGWVPFYAQQADSQYMRHRYWAKITLDHEPSYYVKRNLLWGIQDDFVAIRLRHEVGVQNLMWASDFPHVSSDWPQSLRLLEKMLGEVPDEERRAITCENAVSFYRL